MQSARHKLKLWKIRRVSRLLDTALRKCPINARSIYERLDADSVCNIGKGLLCVREGEVMSYEAM